MGTRLEYPLELGSAQARGNRSGRKQNFEAFHPMHGDHKEGHTLQTTGTTRDYDMLAAPLMRGIVFGLILSLGSVVAADKPISDFEWQLNIPGRTLFRDRTPVGQIELTPGNSKGLFAKKGKVAGEFLQFVSDIAFQPGDTTRYFALGLRLFDGEQLLAESFADADELPALLSAARYIVSTSANIAETERPETEVFFQVRAGFKLQFLQVGTVQAFAMSFKTGQPEQELSRPMTRDHVSILADLIDLALFELNRQGADIKIPKTN